MPDIKAELDELVTMVCKAQEAQRYLPVSSLVDQAIDFACGVTVERNITDKIVEHTFPDVPAGPYVRLLTAAQHLMKAADKAREYARCERRESKGLAGRPSARSVYGEFQQSAREVTKALDGLIEPPPESR